MPATRIRIHEVQFVKSDFRIYDSGDSLPESDFVNSISGIRFHDFDFANRFCGVWFRESGFAKPALLLRLRHHSLTITLTAQKATAK